ncbi:MAG: hypothetical protein ACLUW6_07425 [Coriobacteriaceae bacterium]
MKLEQGFSLFPADELEAMMADKVAMSKMGRAGKGSLSKSMPNDNETTICHQTA